MPPTPPHAPETNTDFMLPEGHRSGSGPIVGIIIIIVLLVFGALYFWGAQLNRAADTLPFIPGDATTTQQ